jgi:cell division protein FtsB
VLAFPVVAVSVSIYFDLNTISGPNGILAFENAKARLEFANANLVQISDKQRRFARRIALMEQPGGDADLVEELARDVLMDVRPSK